MLSPWLAERVRAFRESEGAGRRAARFQAVAYELERDMRTRRVSQAAVLECFGPPDLWVKDEVSAAFVYFYDEEAAGQNRDEWYFHFSGGTLVDSGYNRRGINDLSGLRDGREFPGASA